MKNKTITQSLNLIRDLINDIEEIESRWYQFATQIDGEEGMNSKAEEHLLSLKREFAVLVDKKYRKGQEEHGGNLQDMNANDLLDHAIDEAIDQVVYLLTLKNKYKE
jgi:hypothetical protein